MLNSNKNDITAVKDLYPVQLIFTLSERFYREVFINYDQAKLKYHPLIQANQNPKTTMRCSPIHFSHNDMPNCIQITAH